MTRWSEVKEVLSDSSIRDVPEIANEDFVNNAIVNNEIVTDENVNSEIVRSLIVNVGFLEGEDILGNESFQRTPKEQDAINDEVTIVIIVILIITSIIITYITYICIIIITIMIMINMIMVIIISIVITIITIMIMIIIVTKDEEVSTEDLREEGSTRPSSDRLELPLQPSYVG